MNTMPSVIAVFIEIPFLVARPNGCTFKRRVQVHPERDDLSIQKGLTATHATVTVVLHQAAGSARPNSCTPLIFQPFSCWII